MTTEEAQVTVDSAGVVSQQLEKKFIFRFFSPQPNSEIKVRTFLGFFVLRSCLKSKESLGTLVCGCLCGAPVWTMLHQAAFTSTNRVSGNYSKIGFFSCDAGIKPRAS